MDNDIPSSLLNHMGNGVTCLYQIHWERETDGGEGEGEASSLVSTCAALTGWSRRATRVYYPFTFRIHDLAHKLHCSQWRLLHDWYKDPPTTVLS